VQTCNSSGAVSHGFEVNLSPRTDSAVRAAPTPRSLDRQWAPAFVIALSCASATEAQTIQYLDPSVVTATRVEQRAFDLPLSIDTISGAQIQQNQLQINLSESLARVPGISIQSRSNYAQDLQISSRGFGARASFGVRGIRVYQDNIPATMPDGQGQVSAFSLVSAKRVEVLRGPFSTLYGNASGGVISIFTEDGTDPPEVQAQIVGGSYGTWNAIGKVRGDTNGLNYVAAANHFEIQGNRDHSSASRDQFNTKLKFDPSGDTRVTLVANFLHQPEAEDPLGLTRAQWDANPRQVDPVALQFNTRKTVNQQQGGATIEQKLSNDTVLRVTGYGGHRAIRQYLALSGVGATSSGGVSDVDGNFGGVDARVSSRMTTSAGTVTATVGADYDRLSQHRTGFVNNNGVLGDLRRDEDNTISDSDAYLQAEWSPNAALSILGGVRYSSVKFGSDDHYITPTNPNDSGSVTYHHVSPVIGAAWHVSPVINAYVNWGEGFETPTGIELAYRTAGTGLNFALQPAVSRSTEVGLKAYLSQEQRVGIAAFTADTTNEIIIDAAVGGRTTYKNASKTRRRGVEAQWEGALGHGFSAFASYTYLSAKFASDTTTGLPPQPLKAGSKLPGVPASSAYAEIAWSRPAWFGFSSALEMQYADKLYVNDLNTAAAPSYTVANWRSGFEQVTGTWTLREFIRVNNLADRNYSGTVIVGDTNGRYFEPSPGRNFVLGITVNAKF